MKETARRYLRNFPLRGFSIPEGQMFRSFARRLSHSEGHVQRDFDENGSNFYAAIVRRHYNGNST